MNMIVPMLDPNSVTPMLDHDGPGAKSELQRLDEGFDRHTSDGSRELDCCVVHQALRVADDRPVFDFQNLVHVIAKRSEPFDGYRNDRMRFEPKIPEINQVRRALGIENINDRVMMPKARKVQAMACCQEREEAAAAEGLSPCLRFGFAFEGLEYPDIVLFEVRGIAGRWIHAEYRFN